MDYLLNNAKNDKGIMFTTPPVLADRNAVEVLRCPIYVGYKLQLFICFLDGEYGVFHLGRMYCVSKSCLTALLLAVTVHKYLQAFICIKSSLNHIPPYAAVILLFSSRMLSHRDKTERKF